MVGNFQYTNILHSFYILCSTLHFLHLDLFLVVYYRLNLTVFDSIKLIVIDSRLVVLKTRPNGNYGHNSFEKGKFSKSALFFAPVRLRAPRAPPATLIIVEPFCPWQNVCIIGTPTRAYTSDTRIQCARATRVFRQGRDVKQRTRTTTNGNFTRVTVNGEIYEKD